MDTLHRPRRRLSAPVTARCAKPALWLLTSVVLLIGAAFSAHAQLPAPNHPCVQEDDELRAMRTRLQQQEREHREAVQRWRQAMMAHLDDQARLDLRDVFAVRRYSARSEWLDERARALNEGAHRSGDAQQLYQARLAAANQRCAGWMAVAVMAHGR